MTRLTLSGSYDDLRCPIGRGIVAAIAADRAAGESVKKSAFDFSGPGPVKRNRQEIENGRQVRVGC